MLRRLLLSAVTIYRRSLGPALGENCRFTPSCSAYAQEAIARHGAGRGTWLVLKRVCRCHPYHRSGYDPVP